MTGGYEYPPFGPQRAQAAVSRLIAAGLLVLAAALAAGGSFGAFSIYHFESTSQYVQTSTTTTTAWGVTTEPPSEELQNRPDVLDGIPLLVGAVLAVVAAVLLVVSARRPGDPAPGRLLGIGAAGLLAGVVAMVWLDLIASSRAFATAAETADPESEFQSTFEVGLGAYLILVGGLAVLAAAVLLLVPRRGTGHGPVPPFGPGQQQWPGVQQQWPPAPQPWPPPGPAVPPPGWGPPPHP